MTELQINNNEYKTFSESEINLLQYKINKLECKNDIYCYISVPSLIIISLLDILFYYLNIIVFILFNIIISVLLLLMIYKIYLNNKKIIKYNKKILYYHSIENIEDI